MAAPVSVQAVIGLGIKVAWTDEDMEHAEAVARLAAPAVTLPGLGHNAPAEDPELAITLLDPYR